MNDERADDVREALARVVSEAENLTDDAGAWALPEDVADAILSRFDVTPKGQALAGSELAEELEGLADSLDEHVSHEEVYRAVLSSGVVAQIKAEALREAADIASEYDREALHMRDHESDYPESRVGMQYHGMHHGAADVAIRLRRKADQIEQGGEK